MEKLPLEMPINHPKTIISVSLTTWNFFSMQLHCQVAMLVIWACFTLLSLIVCYCACIQFYYCIHTKILSTSYFFSGFWTTNNSSRIFLLEYFLLHLFVSLFQLSLKSPTCTFSCSIGNTPLRGYHNDVKEDGNKGPSFLGFYCLPEVSFALVLGYRSHNKMQRNFQDSNFFLHNAHAN